jgi:hypothetical protein
MTKAKSVSNKMLLDIGNSASRCAMCREAIGTGITKTAFKKIKSLAKRTAVRLNDLSGDEKALLKQAAKDIIKSGEPAKIVGNVVRMVSNKFGSKMAGKGYQCGSGFSSQVGVEFDQAGSGVFDDILGVLETMDPTGMLRTAVIAKTAMGLGKETTEGSGVNVTGQKVGRGVNVTGQLVGRGQDGQDGGNFLGIDWLPRPSSIADTVAGAVGIPKGITSGLLKTVGLGKKPRKPSAWITHVKAYAKEHGCSYKEALSRAKATYKKA